MIGGDEERESGTMERRCKVQTPERKKSRTNNQSYVNCQGTPAAEK